MSTLTNASPGSIPPDNHLSSNISSKQPPRWVGKFLQSLRECGNASKAARLAKVCIATAKVRRRTHPDFAAAWNQALGAFDCLPEHISRPVLPLPSWTRTFLRILKKCGIVTRAAKESGVGATAPYTHRSANPDFAAEWDLAIKPFQQKPLPRRAHASNSAVAQGRKSSGSFGSHFPWAFIMRRMAAR